MVTYGTVLVGENHQQLPPVPGDAVSDRSQTTNDKRRTNGEKFVKSGERTDNTDGQIQDRSRIFNGSIVSPPTHPKTKNCDIRIRTRT